MRGNGAAVSKDRRLWCLELFWPRQHLYLAYMVHNSYAFVICIEYVGTHQVQANDFGKTIGRFVVDLWYRLQLYFSFSFLLLRMWWRLELTDTGQNGDRSDRRQTKRRHAETATIWTATTTPTVISATDKVKMAKFDSWNADTFAFARYISAKFKVLLQCWNQVLWIALVSWIIMAFTFLLYHF